MAQHNLGLDLNAFMLIYLQEVTPSHPPLLETAVDSRVRQRGLVDEVAVSPLRDPESGSCSSGEGPAGLEAVHLVPSIQGCGQGGHQK